MWEVLQKQKKIELSQSNQENILIIINETLKFEAVKPYWNVNFCNKLQPSSKQYFRAFKKRKQKKVLAWQNVKVLRPNSVERDSVICRTVIDDLAHGDAAQETTVEKSQKSGVGDAKLQTDSRKLPEVTCRLALTWSIGCAHQIALNVILDFGFC